MKEQNIGLIKKPERNYRVSIPNQTGFSSPATHYTEPRIDLNEVLIDDANATFFVRVQDDNFKNFGIRQNDVLIIDKSLSPKHNQLMLIIKDGKFEITKHNSSKAIKCMVWGIITYIIKSVK